MKGILLLNYSENSKKIIEEERLKFLRFILENVNMPIQDFWKEEDTFLSANQKIKLHDLLSKWNIQVISYNEGGMKIFNDQTLLGDWKSPICIVKKDNLSDNPRKQFYLEITFDHWSVFEEL